MLTSLAGSRMNAVPAGATLPGLIHRTLADPRLKRWRTRRSARASAKSDGSGREAPQDHRGGSSHGITQRPGRPEPSVSGALRRCPQEPQCQFRQTAIRSMRHGTCRQSPSGGGIDGIYAGIARRWQLDQALPAVGSRNARTSTRTLTCLRRHPSRSGHSRTRPLLARAGVFAASGDGGYSAACHVDVCRVPGCEGEALRLCASSRSRLDLTSMTDSRSTTTRAPWARGLREPSACPAMPCRCATSGFNFGALPSGNSPTSSTRPSMDSGHSRTWSCGERGSTSPSPEAPEAEGVQQDTRQQGNQDGEPQ